MRISDWSSDVCSSDVVPTNLPQPQQIVESEAFLDIGHTDHRVEIFHLASLLRSGPTPMWGIGNGAATGKAQSPGQTLGISARRLNKALHRNHAPWTTQREARKTLV